MSVNPNDYVGEYLFKPDNADSGEFASVVILKKDQTAIEVRFLRDTGQVQTTQKKWYLSQKKWYLSHTTGENVVIGDFAYPVESARPIKLGVNELGQYYERVH